MAKRKPLPYHASYAIDDALMAIADAIRLLVSLMTGEPTTTEERYRRIGLAVDRLHKAVMALKEIKTSSPA